MMFPMSFYAYWEQILLQSKTFERMISFAQASKARHKRAFLYLYELESGQEFKKET